MTNQIAVLVVEDEPLIRMDVGLRLEEAGFVVFEAANAEQAIAHLKAQPTIRVMFTDIRCLEAWTGWNWLQLCETAGPRSKLSSLQAAKP